MVAQHRKTATGGAAQAEAAGLYWLREGSSAVVEVLGVTENSITTRYYEPARPTAAMAREAGRELASIHAAGAASFGCPPDGWEGPNFIGRVQQSCEPSPSWATFFVQQRVLPFLAAAHDKGNLSADEVAVVEQACTCLLDAGKDFQVPPARIHGDLWAGNLLYTEQGPKFIDPAAHGGHPMTDLAMLDLFGVAHQEALFDAYSEEVGLEGDWRATLCIHQLHPLAVHALTHGRAYGMALAHEARNVLHLL
ncbi:MAG: fructosamine kinase family protein [Corynebacterium sp.]|nr:fructosamine kinase family protein [Corynebacterium sp.]